MRKRTHLMGNYMARFSIKVIDSCETLFANDALDSVNLFEENGREFVVTTNEKFNYSFRVAKEGWDSISIKPSSEILQESFFDSEYDLIDLSDSVEINITWNTDTIHKRNHPYLITYHVTAFKDQKTNHRVLTNAIFVDGPLGVNYVNEEQSSLKIHPNPTSNFLYLDSKTLIQEIGIFNSQGLLVKRHFGVNTLSFDIQFDELPNGLYLLKIKTEEDTVTKKILKSSN
jgi:hypothetical protein